MGQESQWFAAQVSRFIDSDSRLGNDYDWKLGVPIGDIADRQPLRPAKHDLIPAADHEGQFANTTSFR